MQPGKPLAYELIDKTKALATAAAEGKELAEAEAKKALHTVISFQTIVLEALKQVSLPQTVTVGSESFIVPREQVLGHLQQLTVTPQNTLNFTDKRDSIDQQVNHFKGWTPIMVAAFFNLTQLVKEMLTAEADVELQDGGLVSTLGHMVWNYNLEMVKIIFRKSKNPYLPATNWGKDSYEVYKKSPLGLAFRKKDQTPRPETEVKNILNIFLPDPAKESKGQDPLKIPHQNLLSLALRDAVDLQMPEVVALLFQHGAKARDDVIYNTDASPDHKSSPQGKNILTHAVEKGDPKIIAQIRQHGVSINEETLATALASPRVLEVLPALFENIPKGDGELLTRANAKHHSDLLTAALQRLLLSDNSGPKVIALLVKYGANFDIDQLFQKFSEDKMGEFLQTGPNLTLDLVEKILSAAIQKPNWHRLVTTILSKISQLFADHKDRILKLFSQAIHKQPKPDLQVLQAFGNNDLLNSKYDFVNLSLMGVIKKLDLTIFEALWGSCDKSKAKPEVLLAELIEQISQQLSGDTFRAQTIQLDRIIKSLLSAIDLKNIRTSERLIELLITKIYLVDKKYCHDLALYILKNIVVPKEIWKKILSIYINLQDLPLNLIKEVLVFVQDPSFLQGIASSNQETLLALQARFSQLTKQEQFEVARLHRLTTARTPKLPEIKASNVSAAEIQAAGNKFATFIKSIQATQERNKQNPGGGYHSYFTSELQSILKETDDATLNQCDNYYHLFKAISETLNSPCNYSKKEETHQVIGDFLARLNPSKRAFVLNQMAINSPISNTLTLVFQLQQMRRFDDNSFFASYLAIWSQLFKNSKDYGCDAVAVEECRVVINFLKTKDLKLLPPIEIARLAHFALEACCVQYIGGTDPGASLIHAVFKKIKEINAWECLLLPCSPENRSVMYHLARTNNATAELLFNEFFAMIPAKNSLLYSVEFSMLRGDVSRMTVERTPSVVIFDLYDCLQRLTSTKVETVFLQILLFIQNNSEKIARQDDEEKWEVDVEKTINLYADELRGSEFSILLKKWITDCANDKPVVSIKKVADPEMKDVKDTPAVATQTSAKTVAERNQTLWKQMRSQYQEFCAYYKARFPNDPNKLENQLKELVHFDEVENRSKALSQQVANPGAVYPSPSSAGTAVAQMQVPPDLSRTVVASDGPVTLVAPPRVTQ